MNNYLTQKEVNSYINNYDRVTRLLQSFGKKVTGNHEYTFELGEVVEYVLEDETGDAYGQWHVEYQEDGNVYFVNISTDAFLSEDNFNKEVKIAKDFLNEQRSEELEDKLYRAGITDNQVKAYAEMRNL